MITLQEIRKNLTDSIKNSGMTQIEICRQLGISAATMSQYMSGRAMPALDTFANLCIIIDESPNYILLSSTADISNFNTTKKLSHEEYRLLQTFNQLTATQKKDLLSFADKLAFLNK